MKKTHLECLSENNVKTVKIIFLQHEMSEAQKCQICLTYRYDCILFYDEYSENTESDRFSPETVEKHTYL